MSPLLEITGLTLSLDSRTGARTLLRGIDLSVEEGEAVGIVGESGAGKSMLARSIMRMLPDGAELAGTLRFGEQDVHDLTTRELKAYRRGGVALIPQDPRTAINPVHTVGDFLTEPLVATGGVPAQEARRRAETALRDVAIDNPAYVLTQYPHQLSGGMLQRVMICAALLAESRLIVADEPTTALDATTQSDVMAILTDLRRSRGLALVFITHDLELATAVCDRIAVMYAGEIVEVQAARTLETAPAHPYTRALFAASPRIDALDAELIAIPGRPVAAFEADPGSCGFSSRCVFATEECTSAHPVLRVVENAASVRCVRAEHLDREVFAPVRVSAAAPARVDELGASELVLEVRDLRKVFSTRGRAHTDFVAVDGVSLTVPRGGSVAVVGESGSGKTTLARMIAGLEAPTAGRIEVLGAPRGRAGFGAKKRRFARDVQMVFQNPYSSLDPRQSGERCIDEVLAVHFGMEPAARRARIAELGEQVGLAGRALAALPGDLSGGQRQRLAIARALALEPELLILDEAVAALDVSVQAQILNLLADLRRELGLSFLFISHDLAVVGRVSESVIVMRRGKVVESGLTAEVLTRPQAAYTRALEASLPRRGWVPRRRPASLDEVEAEAS